MPLSSPIKTEDDRASIGIIVEPFGNGVCQSGERIGVRQSKHDSYSELDEFLDYLAKVGPPIVKDRAGGVPDPASPDVMRIPVCGDRYALVDAEDYPLVMAYSWWSHDYAFTTHTFAGKKYSLLMHRLVLMAGVNTDSLVDHINHDRLDNRKVNLRLCQPAGNVRNGRLRSDSSTGIKGVTLENGKWRAGVKAAGRTHVRIFLDKEEAAEWVKAKRLEIHGEFACHG